ncbi:hypothetical protein RUM44_001638 [Polyplax serrata]|uniref:Plexin domain-containing protein 2 n=1 Tax=Polyplax serrata TaxID=468196 RepID=A0ABR1AKM6_POLSC
MAILLVVMCVAGHYHIQNAQEQDFETVFVTLDREKRESPPNEKKTSDPMEDKTKVTKKPTSVDVKSTATPTELTTDKSKLATKKEGVVKVLNATIIQSEKDHTEQKHDDVSHVPRLSQGDSTSIGTSTVPSISNHSGADSIGTNMSIPYPDVQISKMFESNLEETLRKHNISTKKQDHHLYYNSLFVVDREMGQRYWVDLDKHKDVKVSDVLSKAYRRAITVKLSFDFPFYGHPIRNITIATGGFLYTGDYVHSWLAATQYIAPLMANFDTSISNHSFVKYLDNGTAFTVQWENVMLKEKQDKGGFTFQCTLHKNGDIVFVYQQVAVVIGEINDDQHPVKVGLSDAYIIDRTIFFVRRKTIYEYHRVNFQKQDIKNWTVIVLNALDTCLDLKDCHSCLTELENHKCNWCANRCSNGMDRHRQDWITNGCDNTKLKTVDECTKEDVEHLEKMQIPLVHAPGSNDQSVMGVAGIMGILFLICLGVGVGMWIFFAYRNPHTPAGQFLIRYRPSQWSWRRGEARYTAATIHM